MTILKLFITTGFVLFSNFAMADNVKLTESCTLHVLNEDLVHYVFEKGADVTIFASDDESTRVTLSSNPEGFSSLWIKASQMHSNISMEAGKMYNFRVGKGTNFKDLSVSCGRLLLDQSDGRVITVK